MAGLAYAGVEMTISTRDGYECVEVQPNVCHPYHCHGYDGKYFMCTSMGNCHAYTNSACSGEPFARVDTFAAPCALLPDSCSMAIATNPKLFLEVDALNNATMTAHVDGQVFHGAFMVSPTNAVAEGILAGISFTTDAGDEFRFQGLTDDNALVNSSAGQCPLGDWCYGSSTLRFRVTNTTGTLDAGGFVVLQESVQFTIDTRWSVETSALHQFFIKEDVICDPTTMEQMTLNIAYGEPFYDDDNFPPTPAILSDFALNRAENYVTYTVTFEGQEPITGNVVHCYPTYTGLSHLLWDCDERLLKSFD